METVTVLDRAVTVLQHGAEPDVLDRAAVLPPLRGKHGTASTVGAHQTTPKNHHRADSTPGGTMPDRSRPPRHIADHQIDAIQADLHKAVDAICKRWLTVQAHAVDWQRGYPSQGDGPGGGGVSDTMAEHLVAELDKGRRVDDPGLTAIEWLWAMVDIPAQLFLMQLQAEDMVPKQPEIQRDSAIGKCECCERDVAKTHADPLRSGLCGKCYAAWKRSGGEDRNYFLAQRRRMLAVGTKATA